MLKFLINSATVQQFNSNKCLERIAVNYTASAVEINLFLGYLESSCRTTADQKMANMFYAVAKGRKTGVFSTREECEAHVDNFPGALFQKFDSKEKAELFLKDAAQTKQILYVVARGDIPGIYWEWTHAQNQLNGIAKTKFKKIDNLEDAELFYDDHRVK